MTVGMLMTAEIAEQPEVLTRLLDTAGPSVRAVASVIKAAGPRFVPFAARGTSDHAGLSGKYLAEVRLGWAAGLASPTSMTAYGATPDLRGVLFVAVSQSGGSPDLVESVTTARACGALTLAVTNDSSSALVGAAQLHLDVLAGPEDDHRDHRHGSLHHGHRPASTASSAQPCRSSSQRPQFLPLLR